MNFYSVTPEGQNSELLAHIDRLNDRLTLLEEGKLKQNEWDTYTDEPD